MKIDQEKLNVERSGDFIEQEFRIKASTKAFEILSSGIYSDKLAALVRELCCNAYDAHKMVGKGDVPFLVKLPNSMEPNFIVRDYGNGMTEEQVANTFTVYFESDKTDSNKFVGYMGLGSKCPFAYTDNFSVTSYVGGKKYVYNLFVNEDRIPTCALMAVEDTDEPTGIEITIAIDRYDHSSISHRASNILGRFDVKPEVTGSSHFEFANFDEEYVIHTDKFAVKKSTWGDSYAIMGNVAYELDHSDMDLVPEHVKLINSGVDFFFEIGELEPAASREKLSLTKKTVQNLKDRFDHVLAEVAKELEKNVSNAKTRWEAMCLFSAAKKSSIGQIAKVPSISWNDIEVNDSITLKEDDEYHESTLIEQVVQVKIRYKRKYSSSIIADPNAVIIHDDLGKRGGYARARRYLEDNSKRSGYFLTCEEGLLVRYGLDKVVIRTSDLPKPTRQSSGGSGNRTVSQFLTLKESKDYSSYGQGRYWNEEEVDLSEGGVYVEVNRYDVKIGPKFENSHSLKGECHVESLQTYFGWIKNIDKDVVICGIKSAALSKLEDHPNWISLWEYMQLLVENTKDELDDELAKVYSTRVCNSEDYFEGFKSDVFADPNGTYAEAVKTFSECKSLKASDKLSSYKRIKEFIGIVSKVSKYDFDKVAEELIEKYPLIACVDTYQWGRRASDKFKKLIVSYIDSIDCGEEFALDDIIGLMRYMDFNVLSKESNEKLKNAIMKACQESNEGVKSMLSNASLINHVA
jgi:transposase